MIVVDTNILVAVVLQRRGDGPAVLARDPHWIVPPLWQSEFCSALFGYIRREGLPVESAIKAYAEAAGMVDERPVDHKRVLELATTTACSAYDLEFAVVAERADVPLVTFDRQLLNEFPSRAMSPSAFIAAS